MLKTTRTWYCDGCGCEITGYKAGIEVIEIDENGYGHSIGRDFCKPCTLSFTKWLDSRKEWGENRENDKDD